VPQRFGQFWTYCLNAKSGEERVVYKRLNSTGTLIQRTTTEAPQRTLCITSGWMFTRRRSATGMRWGLLPSGDHSMRHPEPLLSLDQRGAETRPVSVDVIMSRVLSHRRTHRLIPQPHPKPRISTLSNASRVDKPGAAPSQRFSSSEIRARRKEWLGFGLFSYLAFCALP
jgi:hypothetical protein